MRVFVTGATGYLGSAIARALQTAGFETVGLARAGRHTSPESGVDHWVAGNLREPDTYAGEVGRCDAVVHAAAEFGPDSSAVDLLAIRTILASARSTGHVRSFVYTSGVWVLGVTSDHPVDESVPVDHPAAAVAWRPSHERMVLDGGDGQLVTSVIRPGIVFGEKRGLVNAFFSAALEEKAPMVIEGGENRWPTVHVDDVADLYRRAVGMSTSAVRPLAPHDRVFHAVSGASERVKDIAAAASRAAGRDGTVHSWTIGEARAALGPVADALALDQVVSAPRASRVLGWTARRIGFIPNAAEAFAAWRA